MWRICPSQTKQSDLRSSDWFASAAQSQQKFDEAARMRPSHVNARQQLVCRCWWGPAKMWLQS